MADTGIIGAGSWGCALAAVLERNGHPVTVWSIVEAEVSMLQKEHEHKDKLPGVALGERVSFTSDLKEAAEGKEFEEVNEIEGISNPVTWDAENKILLLGEPLIITKDNVDDFDF